MNKLPKTAVIIELENKKRIVLEKNTSFTVSQNNYEFCLIMDDTLSVRFKDVMALQTEIDAINPFKIHCYNVKECGKLESTVSLLVVGTKLEVQYDVHFFDSGCVIEHCCLCGVLLKNETDRKEFFENRKLYLGY